MEQSEGKCLGSKEHPKHPYYKHMILRGGELIPLEEVHGINLVTVCRTVSGKDHQWSIMASRGGNVIWALEYGDYKTCEREKPEIRGWLDALLTSENTWSFTTKAKRLTYGISVDEDQAWWVVTEPPPIHLLEWREE